MLNTQERRTHKGVIHIEDTAGRYTHEKRKGFYSVEEDIERKDTAWQLKVHKRENFFGSDFELYTFL